MKTIQFDRKTRFLLFFVNMVLLLAIAGVMIVFSCRNRIQQVTSTVKRIDNTKTTQTIIVSDDKIKLNPESVQFMVRLAEKYHLTGSVGGHSLKNGELFELPTYQADGEKFGLRLINSKTDPKGFYYIFGNNFLNYSGGHVENNQDEVLWQSIIDEVKNQGFKVVNSDADVQFDNEQMVCRMIKGQLADPSRRQLSVLSLSLSCLDKTYLTALMNFYRPMVLAMIQDQSAARQLGVEPKLLVDRLTVIPSLMDKYQTIELRFDGQQLTHLLYQKPDETWHYFKSIEKWPLACGDFNTSDLKKAYHGNQCWSSQDKRVLMVK